MRIRSVNSDAAFGLYPSSSVLFFPDIYSFASTTCRPRGGADEDSEASAVEAAAAAADGRSDDGDARGRQQDQQQQRQQIIEEVNMETVV